MQIRNLNAEESKRYLTLLLDHFNTIMALAESDLKTCPRENPNQQRELEEFFVLWHKQKEGF